MRNTTALSTILLFAAGEALLLASLRPAHASPLPGAHEYSADERVASANSASAPREDPADGSPEPDEQAPHGDDAPSFGVHLNLAAVPELELAGTGAQFDLGVAEVELDLSVVEVSVGLFDFQWEGAEALDFSGGAAQPWEQLQTVELRKTIQRPVSEKLFFTASLGAGMSFEDESDDSHYADAFAAVIWQKSADWSFLFGLGYSWHTKIDVEYELFPALGFTYRQNAERGFSASLGIPQTALSYRFSPRSAIALEAGATIFVSRLADDSTVAAAGYAEIQRFDFGLFYQHSVGDRFELRAGPTFGFDGELRIHDSRGILQHTHDLESAPGLALEMAVAF